MSGKEQLEVKVPELGRKGSVRGGGPAAYPTIGGVSQKGKKEALYDWLHG